MDDSEVQSEQHEKTDTLSIYNTGDAKDVGVEAPLI